MEFFGDDDYILEDITSKKDNNVANGKDDSEDESAVSHMEVETNRVVYSPIKEERAPIHNTNAKAEVKSTISINISPVTMIETVQLIEDLRDLFKDRPEDYNALMDLVRHMDPENIEHWSAYQKISSIFANVKSEHSAALASRVLRYLRFPPIFVDGIRESGAISKMKSTLEDSTIFNEGSDEEGNGADSKSAGGAERRSERQKKRFQQQDNVFMTPEVKGDIKQFTKLVKDRFTPGDYVKFIQAMDKYLNKNISFEEAAKKFANCLKDDLDLLQKFIGFWEPPLSTRLKQLASKQTSTDAKRDQGRSTSKRKKPTFDDTTDTSTLDLDSLERDGPSYVVLPEQWRKALCSGRTALHRSVLNDKYMIVEGQEGYFKESSKNSAEEILFRCEEDQFEFDRILEVHRTTLRKIKQLQATPEIDYEQILDHIYMKCFMSMHRSNDEVIHILRSRDKVKMAEIASKLQDKISEMQALHVKWNTVWRNTYRKHYLRSLDHQSVNFYAKDMKAMRPEALLAEIRRSYYMSLLEGQNIQYPLSVKTRYYHTEACNWAGMILSATLRKIFPDGKIRASVDKIAAKFFPSAGTSGNFKTKQLFIGDANWVVCLRLISIIISRLEQAAKLSELPSQVNSSGDMAGEVEATFDHFVSNIFAEDPELLYTPGAYKKYEVEIAPHYPKLSQEFKLQRNKMLKDEAARDKPACPGYAPYSRGNHCVEEKDKVQYYVKYVLGNLIIGELTRTGYEELCMVLFGPQAYFLYTMDHLFVNFIRQCYIISQDSVSSKKLFVNAVGADLVNIKPEQNIQYAALFQNELFRFGIYDYKNKNEEFLKQFLWLQYARLHLDKKFFYQPKYRLFLKRNIEKVSADKDRPKFVVQKLNSEAKFDYTDHGFTGYLIARDFMQYRGRKRSVKYTPKKSIDEIFGDPRLRNDAMED